MHSALLPSNDFYQAKGIDVTSTRVTTDHQRIESFNTHFSLLQKIYRKINPTVYWVVFNGLSSYINFLLRIVFSFKQKLNLFLISLFPTTFLSETGNILPMNCSTAMIVNSSFLEVIPHQSGRITPRHIDRMKY